MSGRCVIGESDTGERIRKRQACRGCQKRKKKCDNLIPSCTPCNKWGVLCEYNNPEPILPSPNEVGGPPLQAYAQNLTVTDGRSDVQPYVTPKIAEMPPKHTVLELVDILFSKFRGLIPCFHEQHLRESIERDELQTEAPILVYAIIAMTARYHSNESIRCQEKPWYTNAKLSFDLTGYNSEPALQIVQAAICLICYALMICDFPTIWAVLGKAWNQSCSHGFNRIDTRLISSPALPAPFKSEIEKEERRRSMWMLFIFDRASSFPLGWAHTIDKKYFVVNQPMDDQSFQRGVSGESSESSLSSPFQILSTTYELLGQVVDHTNILQTPDDLETYSREFGKLDAALIASATQSTKQIQNLLFFSSHDQFQVVWIHIVIHVAIIILHHRPVDDWAVIAGVSSNATLPRDLHEKHIQNCLLVVEKIMHFIKYLEKTSVDLLTNPQITSALYIFGRILIIHWHDTWDPDCRLNIDILLAVFEKISDVYTELGQRYLIKIKNDLQADPSIIQKMKALGSRGGISGCPKLAR